MVAGFGGGVAELDVFGDVGGGQATVPCPSMRVTERDPSAPMVSMVQ